MVYWDFKLPSFVTIVSHLFGCKSIPSLVMVIYRNLKTKDRLMYLHRNSLKITRIIRGIVICDCYNRLFFFLYVIYVLQPYVLSLHIRIDWYISFKTVRKNLHVNIKQAIIHIYKNNISIFYCLLNVKTFRHVHPTLIRSYRLIFILVDY